MFLILSRIMSTLLFLYFITLHITLRTNATVNITQWIPSPTPVVSPAIWDWHRGFFSTFDNCIYIVGHSDPWKFNIATETWSIITDFSSTSASLDGQYGTTIGNVFYFQNWDSPDHVHKYDPANSIWDTTYLSMPNDQGKCFTSNNIDIVYIMGSSTKFMHFNINDNPVTLQYGTNIDGTGAAFAQCGYYNGYVYMFGSDNHALIKKYYVGNNNEFWNESIWNTLLVNMPASELSYGQAILVDNIFYIAGFSTSNYRKSVYAFDVLTETFIYANDLNTNRPWGTVVYSTYDDRLYVLLGGYVDNYEYSNILHSNVPTMSPLTFSPTIISVSPTTSYPTITRLPTVIDGQWYDDFKLINHPLVLGWNMSVETIINGSTVYYGPFTENNNGLQDYSIKRKFQCLQNSNVRLNFTELHCNTGETDWIDVTFVDRIVQKSMSSSGVSNNDPILQTYCTFDGSITSYMYPAIVAGQIFDVIFDIKITEVNIDYIVIYDILINCDPIGNPTTNQPTTSIPITAIPSTITPSTNQPTTSIPTSSIPTLYPTTTNPTIMPTTFNPTTVIPTTKEPSTINPTTLTPTSANPTTSAPSDSPAITKQTGAPAAMHVVTTTKTPAPQLMVPTPKTTEADNGEVSEHSTTNVIINTIDVLDKQNILKSFISEDKFIFIIIGMILGLLLCICVVFIVKLRERKRKQKEKNISKMNASNIAMTNIENNNGNVTASIDRVVSVSSYNENENGDFNATFPNINAVNSLLVNSVMDNINIGSNNNTFNTAGVRNIVLINDQDESNDTEEIDDEINSNNYVTNGEIVSNNNNNKMLVNDESEETDDITDDDPDLMHGIITIGGNDEEENKQMEGTDTEGTDTEGTESMDENTNDDDIHNEIIGDHQTVLPPPPPKRIESHSINDVAMDPIVIGDDENFNDYIETAGH
eukprot:483447_1